MQWCRLKQGIAALLGDKFPVLPSLFGIRCICLIPITLGYPILASTFCATDLAQNVDAANRLIEGNGSKTMQRGLEHVLKSPHTSLN